jgi:hypothetical protein
LTIIEHLQELKLTLLFALQFFCFLILINPALPSHQENSVFAVAASTQSR